MVTIVMGCAKSEIILQNQDNISRLVEVNHLKLISIHKDFCTEYTTLLHHIYIGYCIVPTKMGLLVVVHIQDMLTKFWRLYKPI